MMTLRQTCSALETTWNCPSHLASFSGMGVDCPGPSTAISTLLPEFGNVQSSFLGASPSIFFRFALPVRSEQGAYSVRKVTECIHCTSWTNHDGVRWQFFHRHTDGHTREAPISTEQNQQPQGLRRAYSGIVWRGSVDPEWRQGHKRCTSSIKVLVHRSVEWRQIDFNIRHYSKCLNTVHPCQSIMALPPLSFPSIHDDEVHATSRANIAFHITELLSKTITCAFSVSQLERIISM